MSTAPTPIGIDLDNTIVDYSELLADVAANLGYTEAAAARGKGGVRAAVRSLPEGELKWQGVQAIAYGRRMVEARLIDGVLSFAAECRSRGIPLRIISHKTGHAAADPDGVDLRDAARNWLASSGILEAGGLGLNDVFFEDTRASKIGRIRQLGCSHFIDDLDEVFIESDFPPNTIGLLYDPHAVYPDRHRGLAVCRSWREISRYVFNGSH